MTIRDCIRISWHASAIYTIIRILLNAIVPILSLIDALLCKYILDILSKSYSSDPHQKNTLLFSYCYCSLLVLHQVRNYKIVG